MVSTSEQIVVVSGGSGGVGLAITQMFAEQGDRVYVVERPETAHRIAALGNDRISMVGTDVLDETSVQQSLQEIYNHQQHIDVLVNVVGGYAAGDPIHTLDAAIWDRMMQLNLRSAFLMSKHAAALMIPNNHGRIINFSSRAARDTSANSGAYAVSKAGVIALTEVQSKELLPYSITVNAILPSIVDTDANRSAMPDADFSAWPKAEEIAQVVVFLASDAAKLISGAGIPVYGRG